MFDVERHMHGRQPSMQLEVDPESLLEYGLLALELLPSYGLARCSRCERIMMSHHLTRPGRCQDEEDCILARQLAWRAARAAAPAGPPE